jgi:ankyrin repeat protein
MVAVSNYEEIIKSNNMIELQKEITSNPALISIRNERDRSMLMVAVIYNAYECALMLIESGSDVNDVNKDGQTPLMYAAHWNRLKLAECLLHRGADISRRSTQSSCSALDLFMTHSDEINKQWILLFNQYKDKLDAKDLELLYDNRLQSLLK